MPKPRNKQEALQREITAWEMRTLGQSEDQIAQKLGVTQQAVSLILKRVYDRKNAALEDLVAQQKVIILSRLEWATAQAAEAWERSKQDAEQNKTVTKKQGAKTDLTPPDDDDDTDTDPEDVEGGLYLDDDGEEIEPEERARRLREAGRKEAVASAGDSSSGIMLTVEEVTTHLSKGQTGNPAHLANVLKATQDIRDLFGLDAPKDGGAGTTVVVKVYEGRNVEDEV